MVWKRRTQFCKARLHARQCAKFDPAVKRAITPPI